MKREIGLALSAIMLPLCSSCTSTGTEPLLRETGPSLSRDGFTLTSRRLSLPREEAPLLGGVGAELTNANCMACHSAGMILTQPKLSEKQWIAVIEKMRTTYKAPIADADVPQIAAYLSALPHGQ